MGRKIQIKIVLEEEGQGLDVTIQTPLDAVTMCKILSRVVADTLEKIQVPEKKIIPVKQAPRWPTN